MRGLKYNIIPQRHITCVVALYTSAWIEIVDKLLKAVRPLVALYTSAWIENMNKQERLAYQHVALYTSAWIEIMKYAMKEIWELSSHSIRVRGLKYLSDC